MIIIKLANQLKNGCKRSDEELWKGLVRNVVGGFKWAVHEKKPSIIIQLTEIYMAEWQKILQEPGG